MKKSLFKTSSILFIALSLFLSSCDDVKNLLTIEVPVNPPAVDLNLINPPELAEDGQQKVALFDEGEIVLAEKTFKMGLIEALKEHDADIANLKKLTLKTAAINVIDVDHYILKEYDLEKYDLTELSDIKVYFDKELVAEVLKVDKLNKKIIFKITKGDIMSYANKKDILVQITGKKKLSVLRINAKLTLEFLAKVGLK